MGGFTVTDLHNSHAAAAESEDASDISQGDQPKHRRRSDTPYASIGRAVVWAVTALASAYGGSWYVRQTGMVTQQAAQEIVDQKARTDLMLLRAELSGRLDLLAQQVGQTNELIRELRSDARNRQR